MLQASKLNCLANPVLYQLGKESNLAKVFVPSSCHRIGYFQSCNNFRFQCLSTPINLATKEWVPLSGEWHVVHHFCLSYTCEGIYALKENVFVIVQSTRWPSKIMQLWFPVNTVDSGNSNFNTTGGNQMGKDWFSSSLMSGEKCANIFMFTWKHWKWLVVEFCQFFYRQTICVE